MRSLQEAGTADLHWLDPNSPSYRLPWSMRKVGVLFVVPTVIPLSTTCPFIYISWTTRQCRHVGQLRLPPNSVSRTPAVLFMCGAILEQAGSYHQGLSLKHRGRGEAPSDPERGKDEKGMGNTQIAWQPKGKYMPVLAFLEIKKMNSRWLPISFPQ